MEFKLPDIGEGVAEGEITKWLVKAGESVKADQPMVEVMTDKATVEIPSPMNGTIDELLANEGETVPVGQAIVRIAGAGDSAVKKPSNGGAHAPQDRPVSQPAPTKSAATKSAPAEDSSAEVLPFKVLATPATRKLARDLQIDLTRVEGTGPHGRITKVDVQMVYEGKQAATSRSSHPSPSTAVATRTKAPVSYVPSGSVERIPLRGVRKKIAEAMTRSKHTAAHFTYVEEVDMSEIVKMRSAAKEEAKARGIKLTFLPFIIKALIPALREFPYLNSSLDDENQEILLKGDFNIGIATDTDNGLMVPVIKTADRKSIWDLADEIETLSEKTRTGKVSVDDLKGGTFTITNAGSIGGVFATPVINHPEVAILGVNAIRKRPVVKGDQIAIADMMFLSLSVDHRVVDGADAARFMNRLVYFLSDPKRFVFA
ncbi:MAG: 2-oxo acid dehydrogenase subunit E2 [Bdellovibrionales bacterium]|nr:2-oxo acid dehydrogenase subunit E2 [Bdellovibrionales bacterium]